MELYWVVFAAIMLSTIFVFRMFAVRDVPPGANFDLGLGLEFGDIVLAVGNPHHAPVEQFEEEELQFQVEEEDQEAADVQDADERIHAAGRHIEEIDPLYLLAYEPFQVGGEPILEPYECTMYREIVYRGNNAAWTLIDKGIGNRVQELEIIKPHNVPVPIYYRMSVIIVVVLVIAFLPFINCENTNYEQDCLAFCGTSLYDELCYYSGRHLHYCCSPCEIYFVEEKKEKKDGSKGVYSSILARDLFQQYGGFQLNECSSQVHMENNNSQIYCIAYKELHEGTTLLIMTTNRQDNYKDSTNTENLQISSPCKNCKIYESKFDDLIKSNFKVNTKPNNSSLEIRNPQINTQPYVQNWFHTITLAAIFVAIVLFMVNGIIFYFTNY